VSIKEIHTKKSFSAWTSTNADMYYYYCCCNTTALLFDYANYASRLTVKKSFKKKHVL